MDADTEPDCDHAWSAAYTDEGWLITCGKCQEPAGPPVVEERRSDS